MVGFDPDEYGGYDGEDDELYAVENAYSEADRTSRPISILLDVYKKYQQKDPVADRVAEDSEALQWLDDYWQYVCMVEHGNEGSVEDVGGFVGFARSFSDYAPEIAEYLLYDDINEIDGDARGLYERFIPIAQRYGGNVSKMKKSFENYQGKYGELKTNDGYTWEYVFKLPNHGKRYEWTITHRYEGEKYQTHYRSDTPWLVNMETEGAYDTMEDAIDFIDGYVESDSLKESTTKSIHDMIAQCRENNNALVKSRLDVHGNDVKKDSYDDYEHYDNYADTSTLNDILYYAMACEEEMRSIEELDGEGVIAFKCDPEEYRRKIIECKQMCDWLTDNITVYRYR